MCRSTTPPFSNKLLDVTPFAYAISEARDSKAALLLTTVINEHNQFLLKTWLCRTYPNATSPDAITCLSYTAIHSACAKWYRKIQFSPHFPSASRHSQQPTSQDKVIHFRAPLCRDFHPFTQHRVVTVTSDPVSVSPNTLY